MADEKLEAKLIDKERREHPLKSDINIIGRSEMLKEKGIYIDPSEKTAETADVAEFHGLIIKSYGEYYYFDLKSSAGTKIRRGNLEWNLYGNYRKPQLLRNGDEIILGYYPLIFKK